MLPAKDNAAFDSLGVHLSLPFAFFCFGQSLKTGAPSAPGGPVYSTIATSVELCYHGRVRRRRGYNTLKHAGSIQVLVL